MMDLYVPLHITYIRLLLMLFHMSVQPYEPCGIGLDNQAFLTLPFITRLACPWWCGGLGILSRLVLIFDLPVVLEFRCCLPGGCNITRTPSPALVEFPNLLKDDFP
jgi:hypothetical protein